MDIEELKRSIDKGSPVIVTETGEIVDPSEFEGDGRPTVKPDRWY